MWFPQYFKNRHKNVRNRHIYDEEYFEKCGIVWNRHQKINFVNKMMTIVSSTDLQSHKCALKIFKKRKRKIDIDRFQFSSILDVSPVRAPRTLVSVSVITKISVSMLIIRWKTSYIRWKFIWMILVMNRQNHKKHIIGGKLGDNDENMIEYLIE